MLLIFQQFTSKKTISLKIHSPIHSCDSDVTTSEGEPFNSTSIDGSNVCKQGSVEMSVISSSPEHGEKIVLSDIPVDSEDSIVEETVLSPNKRHVDCNYFVNQSKVYVGSNKKYCSLANNGIN